MSDSWARRCVSETGAYSLAMVVGYFSSNRAVTLLSQYALILLSFIYFMALIFFYEERPVNPQVLNFWDCLYWAFLNVTTVGSDIEAVTLAGKIGTVALAMSGMLMLPLFTVFITDRVKEYNTQRERLQGLSVRIADNAAQPADTTAATPQQNTPSAAPSPTGTPSGKQ